MEKTKSEVDEAVKALAAHLSSDLESFVGSKASPATFEGIRAQLEKSVAGTEVEVKAGKISGTVDVEIKAKRSDMIDALRYLDVPVIERTWPCKDRHGKTIEARDLVKFNPKSENTAKKCKRLKVGQIYKVDEVNGGSIKITTGHLTFNWYKSTNFEVQERPLSNFMQELQNL